MLATWHDLCTDGVQNAALTQLGRKLRSDRPRLTEKPSGFSRVTERYFDGFNPFHPHDGPHGAAAFCSRRTCLRGIRTARFARANLVPAVNDAQARDRRRDLSGPAPHPAGGLTCRDQTEKPHCNLQVAAGLFCLLMFRLLVVVLHLGIFVLLFFQIVVRISIGGGLHRNVVMIKTVVPVDDMLMDWNGRGPVVAGCRRVAERRLCAGSGHYPKKREEHEGADEWCFHGVIVGEKTKKPKTKRSRRRTAQSLLFFLL